MNISTRNHKEDDYNIGTYIIIMDKNKQPLSASTANVLCHTQSSHICFILAHMRTSYHIPMRDFTFKRNIQTLLLRFLRLLYLNTTSVSVCLSACIQMRI